MKEKKTINSSEGSSVKLRDENSINYIFDGQVWSNNISSLDIEIFDSAFVDENICSGEKITDDHHKNLNNLILGKAGVVKQKRIDALTAKIIQNGNEKTKMSQEFNERRIGCTLDELIGVNIVTQNIDSEIEKRTTFVGQIQNSNTISSGLNIELKKLSFDLVDYRLKLSEKLSVDIGHIKEHLNNFCIQDGSLKFIKDGIGYQKTLKEGSHCVLCGNKINKESAEHFITFQKFFSTRYQTINSVIRSILENFKNTNIGLSLTNIMNICEKNKIPCLFNNNDISRISLLLNTVRLDIDNKHQNLDTDFNFSNFEEFEKEFKRITDFIKSVILKLPKIEDLSKLNIELRNLRLEKIKKENWLNFCKKYQNLDKENLKIQNERADLITELVAEMDKVVADILTDLNKNLLDLGADFSIFKLEHRRKIRTTDKSLYSLLFKNKVLPLVAEKGSYCFNNILSDSG